MYATQQVLAGIEFVKRIPMIVPMAILETTPPISVSIVIICSNVVCPASEVTFGDELSKTCVRECPDNPNNHLNQPDTYYADISNRLCVLTCNGSHTSPLFGNNNTRTCVPRCLDDNAYA